MQKINFQNLPSTTTPINATNLNAIQSNAETAINSVSNKLNNIVDAYQDTTGNDWKELIKNKLDYCINNLGTTEIHYEAFINGGWHLVEFGFGVFSKIDNAYQIIWYAPDGIYYGLKYQSNYYYRKQELYPDGFFEKIPNNSITINAGSLSTNSSYISNRSLNINLKITGVTQNAGTTLTIATIPYHASTEASLMAISNNYQPLVCWIRNNGTIAIVSGTALNNAEIRIVGSLYID